MKILDNHILETWARSRVSEAELPHLIKDFITASIKPDLIRFPSGDLVWLPGLDGIVECAQGNLFVPSGASCWEVGTTPRIKSKANKDYNKRTKDKKIKHGSTTFVFVTPFPWKEKGEWEREKRAENKWKDVKVIDAVTLIDWFEATPSIAIRFLVETKHIPPQGLEIPDEAWKDWATPTTPAIKEELVLAGREKQQKELFELLSGPPALIFIKGNTASEAFGFALAALRAIENEEERNAFRSRSIVAEDEKTARLLRAYSNLVIILEGVKGEIPRTLIEKGSHIIIPIKDSFYSQPAIELTRPLRSEFKEALAKMGFPVDDLDTVAHKCSLSVIVYKRLFGTSPPPKWVLKRKKVKSFLPAILAGSWEGDNEEDKKILSILAGGTRYETLIGTLDEFLLIEDAPLARIGETYSLQAAVEAFIFNAKSFKKKDLELFKKAFRMVFSQINPTLDLPPDEWFYSGLKKQAVYSETLRSGLAETLLLISQVGPNVGLTCVNPKAFVEEVIKGLPKLQKGFKPIASLNDVMPRLLEAAPDPLLNSLRSLLEANPKEAKKLFLEGGGLIGGHNFYTGLLWGLEVLAWCPEFLERVSLILANLAEIDPGGRLSNRPINSLRDIFLWWLPGTNATTDEKVLVLKKIYDETPSVGWELIEQSLPNYGNRFSSGTAKPKWKDCGDLPEEVKTRNEQVRYAKEIFEFALEKTSENVQRWKPVLDSSLQFSPDLQKKTLQNLKTQVSALTTEKEKSALWEILRDFISDSKTFKRGLESAGDFLKEVELLLPLLVPEDLYERNRWLFNEYLPDLPSGERDLTKREEELKKIRIEAIKSIYAKHKLIGIIDFAKTTTNLNLVAGTTVRALGEIETIFDLIKIALKEKSIGPDFAKQLSGSADFIFKNVWRKFLLSKARKEKMKPQVLGSLVTLWEDTKATWELVEGLGKTVSEQYWSEKPAFLIDGPDDERMFQIEKLLENGRATNVFRAVSREFGEIPSKLLLKIFDDSINMLAKLQTNEEVRRAGIDQYHIEKFLENLAHRKDVPLIEIARREYKVLPLLRIDNLGQLAIYRVIGNHPDFFVEIICDVYKPRKAEHLKENLTEEQKNKASYGYRLLEGMEFIPGTLPSGDIEKGKLGKWITKSQELAREKDREEVTNLKIGAILAHAKEDLNDKIWPEIVIREIIEKFGNKDVLRGISIERFNMRGVYHKAVYEGGIQERALANQYFDWATKTKNKWPKTSKMLREISEDYERQAESADIRAEREKRLNE